VNGVTPEVGLHPPAIRITVGSTSVIAAAIYTTFIGEQFESSRASESLHATLSFFESDGITSAAIVVSDAPEPATLGPIVAGRFAFWGIKRLMRRSVDQLT
jgi:hypothetical protein